MSQQVKVMREVISYPGCHLNLNTYDSNKNVRVNSKTFTVAASIVGLQCKPRAGVAMTDNIYGGEFEPGINSGFTGKGIVGVASRPTIKGSGAAGNLSGSVYAFEADVGSDSGSTRTVAGVVAALKAFNSMHGTVTGGVFVLNILSAGGNVEWTGLLKAEASGAGGVIVSADGMVKDPETNAEAGYISIYVGSTRYEIPIYAVT